MVLSIDNLSAQACRVFSFFTLTAIASPLESLLCMVCKATKGLDTGKSLNSKKQRQVVFQAEVAEHGKEGRRCEYYI